MVNNMTANTHGPAPHNHFRTFKPRWGWRHATLTQQHTLRHIAHRMGWPVNEAQPDVPMVRAALSILNMHRTASPYSTLMAHEALHTAAGVPPSSQAWELAQSCLDLAERMTEI